MTPAVSYLRMSTDAQEASIPAQRNAVRMYAEKHGYRIVREYVDSGISGDDTGKRLAFQRMLMDASKRDFKVILCWDQDRFGRFDLMEAGYWIKPLRDAGVSLATVSQGAIDWNDFAGRLVYSIQQEGKHQFLRDLSRNVNRGKLAKAQAGKWMGGAAPYGYQLAGTATLAINHNEAETVRLIFRLIGEGQSLTGTRDELNARGIPSPNGGSWRRTAISRIVDNIVYCGHIRYNRTSQARYSTVLAGTIIARTGDGRETVNDPSTWTVVKNAHPPIVTDSQFAAAHAVRRQPFAWSGRPSGHVVVFRGLLKCHRCGRAMHANWVAVMNDVVYVCSGYTEKRECDPNRTYQKPLLQHVIQSIFQPLLNPAAIAIARDRYMASKSQTGSTAPLASVRKSRAALVGKLAQAETRLLEVPRDMVAVVSGKVRELRQQLESLDAQILEAERSNSMPRADHAASFAQHIAALRDSLATLEQGEDSLTAKVMQQTFSQLTVKSEKGSPDRPKGRYRITEVWPTLKNTGFLHS